MGFFEWAGGIGSAVGRTVGSTVRGASTWAGQQGARVGSLIPRRAYASSMRAPQQVITGRVPIRPYTPLPQQRFGVRYAPGTQSARVSNVGVTLQTRRATRQAALVPNRFNAAGRQVYRKAQTVTTQERVASDIAAAQERRVDAFLGRRL